VANNFKTVAAFGRKADYKKFEILRRSDDPPPRKAGSFNLRLDELHEKLESDLED
jgi:hypothetical protein